MFRSWRNHSISKLKSLKCTGWRLLCFCTLGCVFLWRVQNFSIAWSNLSGNFCLCFNFVFNCFNLNFDRFQLCLRGFSIYRSVIKDQFYSTINRTVLFASYTIKYIKHVVAKSWPTVEADKVTKKKTVFQIRHAEISLKW